ncbi:MAG: hypothetical protein EOP48_01545 [Sphingobacteriales bacterium]|nr:MAG: hypothetical protein EOP48_01545 [Sphingobacteriales bacterium]
MAIYGDNHCFSEKKSNVEIKLDGDLDKSKWSKTICAAFDEFILEKHESNEDSNEIDFIKSA